MPRKKESTTGDATTGDVAEEDKRPDATLNGASWRYSDARELMGQDIIDGHIPPLGVPFDPKEIYDRLYSGHPYFKNFPYDAERYKNRIVSLQESLETWGMWARHDHIYVEEDLKICPCPTHNIRGEPCCCNRNMRRDEE